MNDDGNTPDTWKLSGFPLKSVPIPAFRFLRREAKERELKMPH